VPLIVGRLISQRSTAVSSPIVTHLLLAVVDAVALISILEMGEARRRTQGYRLQFMAIPFPDQDQIQVEICML
jgi:hypothetical protein